ncbi:hypothetical protein D3C78_701110 [compost metagenome]
MVRSISPAQPSSASFAFAGMVTSITCCMISGADSEMAAESALSINATIIGVFFRLMYTIARRKCFILNGDSRFSSTSNLFLATCGHLPSNTLVLQFKHIVVVASFR